MEAASLIAVGVDLEWPGAVDSKDAVLGELGGRITKVLSSKGWCLIQMPSSEEECEGALSQVGQLRFERPKVEFAADIVGKGGSGKVCHLQPGDATGFLGSYIGKISDMCSSIQPRVWHNMGFRVSSRTEGTIWTSFSSRREEENMKPAPLDQDDVDNEIVASHLAFIQQRKLCCLYFLDTEGGKVSLHPKSRDSPSVQVDVSADVLLVFRCDEMLFEHAPEGDFTIYETWVMDDPPEQNLLGVVAEPTQKASLEGLLNGVGTPLGPRIMIDALDCCLGGGSDGNLHNWNMYCAGCDAQTYVPRQRFDTDVYFVQEGQEYIIGRNSYAVHGGLCANERVMTYNYELFGIKESEAAAVWPKQRVLLEVGYSTLVQAGFKKESLKGVPISVFIGDCGGDWFGTMVNDIRPEASPTVLGNFTENTTASRLSYAMGLKGATAAFNTACSSGLSAFAVGVTSMRSSTSSQFKEFGCKVSSEGALAGGIAGVSGPGFYIGACANSTHSHDGRCFTFDTSADGYARGEGCNVVYFKMVSNEAEKDNMISCCIGCCMNQDGRSATLTAPNGPAQTACTLHSLREGGISAGEVGASECHGTGTPLGDPIEVGALIAVHGRARGASAFGMTSSKSNVGHMEDNAGAGGLFKCILMARFSCCTPNCHLRTMNSNLVHGGFPALFDTEVVDANLNSFIAGVSSFGFGGANAHAEFWSKSTVGLHRVGDVPLKSYDQLTITCPITMGQIDHLTGEPAIDFEIEAPKMMKADVVREPLADYGISRHVYNGPFRFRCSDDFLDNDYDELVELQAGSTIQVCGSWSAWTRMDEMEVDEDGILSTTVVLGETRCEYFYMCVNGNMLLRIYPTVNNASPMILVQGPSDAGQGKHWLIDGRDSEVPVGTAYRIFFRWGKARKKIWWEQVSKTSDTKIVPSIRHTYSIIGSWNSYRFQDMTPGSTDPNTWETRFKISERERDHFQIVRDHSLDQVIYPSEPNTTSTEIPVRGPDDWGAGKYWLVEGEFNEIVNVTLEINDGHILVAIDTQLWESVEGWMRHDYYLKTLINSKCVRMIMAEPGIFKCAGTTSAHYSAEHQGYAESFQILVDADTNHCFYPGMPNAGSGKFITYSPNGQPAEENWLILSMWPSANYEVTFDLTVDDRRKMVTWKLL